VGSDNLILVSKIKLSLPTSLYTDWEFLVIYAVNDVTVSIDVARNLSWRGHSSLGRGTPDL